MTHEEFEALWKQTEIDNEKRKAELEKKISKMTDAERKEYFRDVEQTRIWEDWTDL